MFSTNNLGIFVVGIFFPPEICKAVFYMSKLLVYFGEFPVKTNKQNQKQIQLAGQGSLQIAK